MHLFKFILIINIMCIGSGSIFATGDSLHILKPTDTIMIQQDSVFGTFFYHKVSPKQTLYSLTRFYKIGRDQLAEINPILKLRLLQTDELLKIPLSNKLIRTSEPPKKRDTYTPIYYQVKPGEGLYRIAKSYFNLKLEDLLRLNNNISEIHPGQLLLMGWLPLNAFADKKAESIIKASAAEAVDKAEKEEEKRNNESVNKEKFSSTNTKYDKQSAQGVAFWHKELKSSKGLYVLHRNALPGSIVSITNPMYNNTVYAKVVGKIPANSYPADVMIIVSPEVANRLGAKDSRFFARISYFSK